MLKATVNLLTLGLGGAHGSRLPTALLGQYRVFSYQSPKQQKLFIKHSPKKVAKMSWKVARCSYGFNESRQVSSTGSQSCLSRALSPPNISSNHHTEAERHDPPTAPLTPRDAERPGAGQYRGIYPMTVELRSNEKNCPIEVQRR